MSHFCVLVLIPEETTDVHEEVKRLLAPYDRNLEVPEYETECWCIGRAARDQGMRAANASVKPIAVLWEEYRPSTNNSMLRPLVEASLMVSALRCL